MSNVNDIEPQQISSIPSININHGDSISYNLSSHFIDSEGDGLTFSADALPEGVDLSLSGKLSGTPVNSGDSTIQVMVSDGLNQINSTLLINVNPIAEADEDSTGSGGGSFGYLILVLLGIAGAMRRNNNK